MTGRMMNEFWGKYPLRLSALVGMNLTFMPMHELGLMGMNRRIALYDPQFTDLNVLATIGSYIMAVSTIPFLINAVWSWALWAQKRKQPANPWRRTHARVADALSSRSIENFEELPVLKTGPYDYGLGYIAEEESARAVRARCPGPGYVMLSAFFHSDSFPWAERSQKSNPTDLLPLFHYARFYRYCPGHNQYRPRRGG